MPRKQKVLAIARDAGAANALAPVVRILMKAGVVRVSVVGYRHAEAAFQLYDLPLLGVEDDEKPGAAERLLNQERPSFLLTGTSMKAQRDGALWESARAQGIPSLAVLDHWCNYWQRFSDNDAARFHYMPDKIAVMDEIARRAMVEARCPPEKIAVTGQPYFDDLISLNDAPLRVAARNDLGIEPSVKLIVFVSEPLAKYFGVNATCPTFLGYTEDDTLVMILDALKYLSVKHPVAVIVKLHPLEGPERLHSVIGECDSDDIRVLKRYPPRRLIAAADVVTGMTSVFLLETALMGRPAISLQPGRLHPDSFIESQSEFIKLALTASECRIHLAAALSESKATWQQRRQRALARGFDGLASQRIASLIYKELGLSAREVGIADSG